MAIDEEEREIESRLDKTHQKRILENMERHKQAALEQWANALENPKSNVSEVRFRRFSFSFTAKCAKILWCCIVGQPVGYAQY